MFQKPYQLFFCVDYCEWGGERKGGKEEGKDSKEEVREGRQTGGNPNHQSVGKMKDILSTTKSLNKQRRNRSTKNDEIAE